MGYIIMVIKIQDYFVEDRQANSSSNEKIIKGFI